MLPEVGAPEFLIIAALALIIIGPKDMPVLLRKIGKFVGKMRGMAQEFRASFDELARQSELDDLRKEVEAMRLAQSYDPTGLVPGAYGMPSGQGAVDAQGESPISSGGEDVDTPVSTGPTKPRKAKTAKASAKSTRVSPRAKPAAKAASKAKPTAPKAAPAKARKAAKPKAPSETRR